MTGMMPWWEDTRDPDYGPDGPDPADLEGLGPDGQSYRPDWPDDDPWPRATTMVVAPPD